ncbi:hypothetical protein [Streptosporangium saharense]|uniref:Uncharacterized protein n=1 Tax=Streptosporangium saharense TaxID=1706840 RepID=A0A7W7QVZ6_9ACTN|nr:hypothetical protein [Streptosporangium saharense]MBB4920769.1 hypothetical protein [Streptosporangium saharense]
MTLTAHAAARTHIGHVRRRNEDAAYAGSHLFADAVPNLPARISRFLDGRPEGRSPDLTAGRTSKESLQPNPGVHPLAASDTGHASR